MDRHPRPSDARDRLMRGVALFLVVVLGGCGGYAGIAVNSGGRPVGGAPGIGTVDLRGNPNSAVTAVIATGMLAGAVYGSQSAGSYGWTFRANPFDAIRRTPPALPALDPARTVNEQDCSKPIENWSANLKCR